MVKVYEEYFERKYYARHLSWANLFSWIIMAGVLAVPLIFAIATRNFWSPETQYFGRPNVKFTNEVFIQAEVNGQLQSYSNVLPIQKLILNQMSGALFKSAEYNPKNDRVYQKFQFEFSFNPNGQDVSSISMLLHFTYFIENAVNVKFQAALPIFISSPSGSSISNAKLSGQLRIKQRSTLIPGNGIADTLYNKNFTEELGKFSPYEIFERYTNRNSTLEYDYKSIVQPFGDSTSTVVSIDVLIPAYETILYSPGFVESLKYAWIQYIAILFPVYLFLYYCLLGKGVEAEIFQTIAVNDLPKDPSKSYLYS